MMKSCFFKNVIINLCSITLFKKKKNIPKPEAWSHEVGVTRNQAGQASWYITFSHLTCYSFVFIVESDTLVGLMDVSVLAKSATTLCPSMFLLMCLSTDHVCMSHMMMTGVLDVSFWIF